MRCTWEFAGDRFSGEAACTVADPHGNPIGHPCDLHLADYRRTVDSAEAKMNQQLAAFAIIHPMGGLNNFIKWAKGKK